MNVYELRMSNVTVALRDANPVRFSMRRYGYTRHPNFLDKLFHRKEPCGTPACALGHYASRQDLQTSFSLAGWTRNTSCLLFEGKSISWEHSSVLAHFGITWQESEELFGSNGCDYAQTPHEAIDYINRFIARKWPENDPAFERFKSRLIYPSVTIVEGN